MNKEFFDALESLEKEKGIPKDYMIEKVEAALMAAFKRDNNGLVNAIVKLDDEKKEIKLYRRLTVVEEVQNENAEISIDELSNKRKKYVVGDTYDVEVKTKNFGRIAAQTAKQVIIQGIREKERGIMIKEYESKRENIITAIVEMVDPVSGNATLTIGKNRMTLFKNDQIQNETLSPGDRIKVYVTEVKSNVRGPSVSLSRIHPGLVKRLLELEIPEIADGTVEIVSVSREAGSRTKVAVMSKHENVDPIGTCIGPKGQRKNNITAELKGEKIDFIKFSESHEEYIAAALAPAAVIEVIKLADNDRSYRVIVADDQLSLAIGREGQNARLAAKLTGCKIDIKSINNTEEVGI